MSPRCPPGRTQVGWAIEPFALVLMPAATALIVGGLAGGGEEIRVVLGRLGRWRVSPRRYVATLGLPLAATLLRSAVTNAVGGFDMHLLDGVNARTLAVPLIASCRES